MSHTPGPWRLERDYNGVPEFVFGGDTCVCDFGIEAPKPEDARLIAAAPELYQVCWELEKLTPNSYAAEKARKIIAKLQREGGEKS